MTSTIRLFLPSGSLLFAAGALTHFGILLDGYQHRQAGTAESVIAIVLFLGWALTWLMPAATRTIALVAQGFALLGTCVGIITISIGVGPRSVLDVLYHIVIVILLVTGLVTTIRARTAAPAARSSHA